MNNPHITTAHRGAAYGDMIPNSPLGFIFFISKSHWKVASVAVAAVTIGQSAELLEIWVISNLIDAFVAAETTAVKLDTLVYWGVIFLAITIIGKIFWRIGGFAGITWIVRANATGYASLYNYIVEHSHSYFIDRFAGSLSNKISNAAEGSARITDQSLWRIWPEVLSIGLTLVLFFAIHWSIGLLTIFIVAGVFGFNYWRVKRRRPYVVSYSAASSRLRGEGVDILTNIAAVRQFTNKTYEQKRLGTTLDDRVKKDFKQWYMGEWTMVSNSSFGVLILVVILSVIYSLLTSGHATAGNLVLVLMLLSRLSGTFNMVGMFMNSLIRQYGEIEEGLKEILLPRDILDQPGARNLHVSQAHIEWNNVCFDFGKNRVFNNFNVSIPAGQRVGLVGASGAGKTTFVSLLLRQHELASGEILIDGQNITQVKQDSLRKEIAVVPQEPLLFHRSISENIAYGRPDATKKEIIEAAKKAQALDFIESLPDGFETMVGERGVKLSGGQKQRVAIARAMIKDVPILLLDEATSALDSESEGLIQKALHQLMREKTVIAIAHRLSTLREMDRIIVMDKGKIIEDGSHEALVEYGGVYAKLWNHQAGGFLQE